MYLRSIALSWKYSDIPQWSRSLQIMQRIGKRSIRHLGKSETRTLEGRMCRLPQALHFSKSAPPSNQ